MHPCPAPKRLPPHETPAGDATFMGRIENAATITAADVIALNAIGDAILAE
jgi:hypothetical protein